MHLTPRQLHGRVALATRQDGGMTAIDIPLALHRGENDLPWVDLGDGSEL